MCVCVCWGSWEEGGVVLDDYTCRTFIVVIPTRNDVDVRKID